MPTATINIDVNTSKYLPDTDAAIRIDAIDLSRDLQHPMYGGLTIDRSTTSVSGPGRVRRVLEIILSAEFIAAYPTEDLQRAALTGLFVPTLRAKLPALNVTSSISIS